MAGGSRRSHTKSRNGCGQCKKRRKKCDQRPPRCSNCVKWGVVCDYTALSAAVEELNGRSLARAVSADTRLLTAPVPSAVFNAGDMELLRQYSNGTALTLAGSDEWGIWQWHVPQEAKSHQYLMHALLALSSLHISFMRPADRKEYLRFAYSHHEQALTLFHSVTSITADNSTAVLAYAYMESLYQSGIPVVFDFEGTPSAATAFIHTMIGLSRQAMTFLSPVIPLLQKSPIARLIDVPTPRFTAIATTTDGSPKQGPAAASKTDDGTPDNLFDYLYKFNEEHTTDEEAKAIYKEATDLLAIYYRMIWNEPPRWAHASVWSCGVTDAFFEHLKAQKTYPLILLAHWCVPLYQTPTFWITIWAKRIIKEVYEGIPDDKKYVMSWPAEEIGLIKRREHTPGCTCSVCVPHGIVQNWEGRLSVEMAIRRKNSVTTDLLKGRQI
ncbi:hypothetical protein BDV96DRAFT_691555 [Lophiotrema nucula]|uniref:Zn(2)-C6 fungal-type domain-containing protein n=1 Tax=Lophiotrema nucula TaxID=690887 RepID=A0A6A5YS63_9PLEO|nr:hypothetical protein BDV96DRAFT_691555 [Lophiotrema nucula]